VLQSLPDASLRYPPPLDLGPRLSSLAFVFVVWTLVFDSLRLPSSSLFGPWSSPLFACLRLRCLDLGIRLSLLEARGPSLARDAEPAEDLVVGPEMVRGLSVDGQRWRPQQ